MFLFNIYPVLSQGSFLDDPCAPEWQYFPKIENISDCIENEQEIWVGTNGHGLVRYNKETTKSIVYDTFNSGLPSNEVRTLLESRAGYIFVGTSDGLSRINQNQHSDWQTYQEDNSDLPSNQITDLLESKAGEILIGTNNGLAKFDGQDSDGWEIYNTNNSDLINNNITTIAETNSDFIWIGTDNGLAKFDGQSREGWTIYTSCNSDLPYNYFDESLYNIEITSLLESKSGALFIGTVHGGIAKFDGDTAYGWTVYNKGNSNLSDNHITDMIELETGTIVVGTAHGLNIFEEADTASWKVYTTENSNLPKNAIINLLAVDQQTIGIGVEQALAILTLDTTASWQVYREEDIGVSFLPTSLLKDKDNNIWIGTSLSGLIQFDGVNTWKQYTTDNSDLPSNVITTLMESQSGDIWAGTRYHGVAKFDGTTWTILNTENSALTNNDISNIFENSLGDILVANYNSDINVLKLDESGAIQWSYITAQSTYSYAHPCIDNNTYPVGNAWTKTIFVETKNGDLWIGRHGLFKYNLEDRYIEKTYHATNSDLVFGKSPLCAFNSSITAIKETSNGTVFIATKGSNIGRFDGESSKGWRVFYGCELEDPEQEQVEDITTIVETEEKEVWMGTAGNGIIQFKDMVKDNYAFFKKRTSVLMNEYIKCMLPTSYGTILIGDERGNLYDFGGNESEHCYFFSGRGIQGEFNSLLITSKGTVLAGSEYGSIIAFKKEEPLSSKRYLLDHSDYSRHIITSLLEDQSGNIFIGSSSGVAKSFGGNLDSLLLYNASNSAMSLSRVNCLYQTKSGEILIGSYRKGLIKMDHDDPFQWTVFESDNSDFPDSGNIECILETQSGAIFLGMSDGTLIKFDGNSFYGWTTYNSENSNLPQILRITCLLEDESGTIFIGGLGEALTTFDGVHHFGDSWHTYTRDNSDLQTNAVSHLYKDSFGDIWIVENDQSLVKMNGREPYGWTIYNENNVAGFTCDNIIETKSGDFFIGSSDHFLTFKPNQVVDINFNIADSIILGEQMRLNSNTTTNELTYMWRINNITVSQDSILNYVFPEEGNYTIYLEVEDEKGCIHSYGKTVAVAAKNSCVWPGDINEDGIVNHYDVLFLGMGMETIGEARPDATTTWIEQCGANWKEFFANGQNYKHADTDGDGSISLSDTLALFNNYGELHQVAITPSTNDSTVAIMEAAYQVIDCHIISETERRLTITVSLYPKNGATNLELYGYAFSMGVSEGEIVAAKVNVTDSWLGIAGDDGLTFVWVDADARQLDVALTRLDQINAKGAGRTADMEVTIAHWPAFQDAPFELYFNDSEGRLNSGQVVNSTSGSGKQAMPFPSAHFELPPHIQQGQELVFKNCSKNTQAYEWSINGVVLPNKQEDLTHTFTEAGTYSITLKGIGNPCDDSKTAKIVVPESGTIACYPNPMQDKLYVNLPPETLSSTTQITLYNLQGQQLLTTTPTTTNTLLETTSLSIGVYYLIIQNDGEITDSIKLIKY